jgi:hypothetical protein
MAWGSSPTVGTWSSNYATNPSLTPGAPSGSGGVLLLKVSARNQPTAFNTPTGWTEITADETKRSAVYARVSDGGANDTPTVDVTGGELACAVISRWAGGNETLGSLLNTSNLAGYFAAETSPNGNIVCPTLTPSVDGCLVLRGGMTVNDDATWSTPPSGDTLLTTVAVNDFADMSAAWSYRVQTTAAAVSAGDITNGASNADGYSIAVALTAAASAKYLKLLADASAASDTAVAGRVFNGDDYIGAFTGQAWEADLESGEAVLLVAVADITPDGATLTTSDTPTVFAYNATDATSGPGTATVIEV